MDVPLLNQPPTETKILDPGGPKIRLLFCLNCKTIEEIPDFEGHPEDDTLLEITVSKHESAGVRHAGHLFKVDALLWAKQEVREQIIDQIRAKGSPGLNAIMPNYYETKNQFFEDAMVCWSMHNRPKGQCPDFAHDKKILRPDTKAERKDLGLAPVEKSTAAKVYLCDFCPVKTYNITKAREAKGMYK